MPIFLLSSPHPTGEPRHIRMERFHLAIDLGAESGRVMLGILSDGKLLLEELHRFPNVPVWCEGELHWNIRALLEGIYEGMRKAAAGRRPIRSISTDSWGLDYVLLNERGDVMEPAFHYRDPRTARGVARVRNRISCPEIFAETGIQFMPFNTIYQLAAETDARLKKARMLLPMADAINFHLSGVARSEESLASTTQLYNPRTRAWSSKLLDALHLPRSLFAEIVPGGTRLGPLTPELTHSLGIESFDVIAGCSHDTAAAVAAVPAEGDDWAYISSGTWSLMGIELRTPLLTDECRARNFTNEIGLGGSVRLLKNIIGLWIVQECRREWARQGHDWDYETLTRMASDAPTSGPLIDPEDPRFVAPGELPQKIAAFCRETKQPPPQGPGETIRCVLESLALLYRLTFQQLKELTGRDLRRLHIVGGGSRNELLNQLTANFLGVPVIAGPVEATALGNVLAQAISSDEIRSPSSAREVVRASFPIKNYAPRDSAAAEQSARFAEFISLRRSA
jgi:rhamnulokinase